MKITIRLIENRDRQGSISFMAFSDTRHKYNAIAHSGYFTWIVNYASMRCITPCNGIASHRGTLKALASFIQATKWNSL